MFLLMISHFRKTGRELVQFNFSAGIVSPNCISLAVEGNIKNTTMTHQNAEQHNNVENTNKYMEMSHFCE